MVFKRESIKKKKSALKATEICDKNGLPDRGVFWKIKGSIKKWLLGLGFKDKYHDGVGSKKLRSEVKRLTETFF